MTVIFALLLINYVISGLLDYVAKVHHVELPPSRYISCVLRITIVFTSALWGVLLIMAMTFDRFYGIIRPYKASSVNTVKKAKLTCIFILFFGVAYNIPHIFFSIDVGYDCVPYGKAMAHVYGYVYYWLSFAVNYSLPFVALLIMNSFIIHAVRKRKKLNEVSQQRTKTSELQIFIILLLVTFSFLLLTTMAYMLFLFNMIIDFNQSTKYKAGFQLFYSVSQKTWYTNNGISVHSVWVQVSKWSNCPIQM